VRNQTVKKKKKSPIKTKSGRTVRRIARDYDSEVKRTGELWGAEEKYTGNTRHAKMKRATHI
jgi:hypothetical protein